MVVPLKLGPVVPTADRALSAASSDAIRESAILLHESEAVVVVEFIETAVPVIYATYFALLFYLPNAKYYQDMKVFTEAQLHHVVTNILIYASLELLSLLHIRHSFMRHFGVSVLYQLALTLETEWKIFQNNFVAWVLVVFQYLLVHNGESFVAGYPSGYAGAMLKRD